MSFKAFDLAYDVASLISSVNEVVSITGAMFASGSGDSNVKKYVNIASSSAGVPLGGYWQTAFDASPTASTSTPLLDMTFGYAGSSSAYWSSATPSSSQNEKLKVYREMANSLYGDPDQQFDLGGGSLYPEAFFIMVKRSLQKDELKKGTISINLSSSANGATILSDVGAATAFQQTVGGDYGYLYDSFTQQKVGQVWYNAGVIVLPVAANWASTFPWSGDRIGGRMTGSTIDLLVDGLRGSVSNVSFHNQTNLYSTIYFCRATNSEFNYSSNPTFVDGSKRIIVTSGSNILQTRTYITTIGLYDANDNLLAVAKVNKPITKSPDTEATFKVRLDY